MMRVTIECFSRNRARKRREQVLGRHVQFVAQVFRGLFEFGKIVAVGLDQVADALDRIGLEAARLSSRSAIWAATRVSPRRASV